jgi:hypothetical protein
MADAKLTPINLSSLLSADYCQLGSSLRPAGYDLETDRKRDKWLNGKALIRKAREVDPARPEKSCPPAEKSARRLT